MLHKIIFQEILERLFLDISDSVSIDSFGIVLSLEYDFIDLLIDISNEEFPLLKDSFKSASPRQERNFQDKQFFSTEYDSNNKKRKILKMLNFHKRI